MGKILLLFIATCLSIVSFAQKDGRAPEAENSFSIQEGQAINQKAKAKKYTEQIKKAVDLNNKKYEQVLMVTLQYLIKKDSITQGENIKSLPPQLQQAVKDQGANRKKELEETLGADLYAKWINYRKALALKNKKPLTDNIDDL